MNVVQLVFGGFGSENVRLLGVEHAPSPCQNRHFLALGATSNPDEFK
jgi:hypothetical protein